MSLFWYFVGFVGVGIAALCFVCWVEMIQLNAIARRKLRR